MKIEPRHVQRPAPNGGACRVTRLARAYLGVSREGKRVIDLRLQEGIFGPRGVVARTLDVPPYEEMRYKLAEAFQTVVILSTRTYRGETVSWAIRGYLKCRGFRSFSAVLANYRSLAPTEHDGVCAVDGLAIIYGESSVHDPNSRRSSHFVEPHAECAMPNVAKGRPSDAFLLSGPVSAG